MRITRIYNIEIGDRPRAEVGRFYEEILGLTALPDGCPNGSYSVGVGATSSPIATILTFAGAGSAIRALNFAIAEGTLSKWRAKLSQAGTHLIGRAWQFDEEYLCFVDDSNFDLALSVLSEPIAGGKPDRILGLRGIEVADTTSGELQALLHAVGIEAVKEEGPILRYQIPARSTFANIDVFRSATIPLQNQLVQKAPQRISFEVALPAHLDELSRQLLAAGFEPQPFCGRSSAFVVRLQSQLGLEFGFVCTPLRGASADLR